MADLKVLAMCLAILGLMSLQAFGSPVESDGKMTGGKSMSSMNMQIVLSTTFKFPD